MAAIRSKVEKLNQSREQGTLHHHQCIDELTSHLKNAQFKHVEDGKITSPTRSETPTSFVTVIEVKDPSTTIPTTIASSQNSTSISIAANDSNTTDLKVETTPVTTSTLSQQQSESKDEVQSTISEKCDENNASPVQTVEIRRKIPPR